MEQLLATIREARAKYDLECPPPASPQVVEQMATEFKRQFEVDLPPAYRDFLLLSDGLREDGLTMWPAARHGEFSESLISANVTLRETQNEDPVYLGMRDDSLFVWDLNTGRYIAVDVVALDEWQVFDCCEDMLRFMLSNVAGL